MTLSLIELTKSIRHILKTSDLATLSRKMVRKQLEEEYGTSMNEYKTEINEAIAKIIAEQDEEEEEEDDEESDLSEEEQQQAKGKKTTTKAAKKPATKRKSATTTKEKKVPTKRRRASIEEGGEKPKRNPKGALTSKVALSPELAEITGEKEMTRPEIVKALWRYIHEHNLQDPNDKRNILLNDKLKSVFGRDSFTMFTMNKYIKRHVQKPEYIEEHGWEGIERTGESSDEDEEKKAEKERKKEMRRLRRLEKKQETKKTKKKRTKKEGSENVPNGLNALFKVSDEMKQFLDGAEIASRPNVIKKLWVYIKERNLQNPENKREILCDAFLHDFFGGEEKITMFQMNRLIGRHFLEKVPNWQEIAKKETEKEKAVITETPRTTETREIEDDDEEEEEEIDEDEEEEEEEESELEDE